LIDLSPDLPGGPMTGPGIATDCPVIHGGRMHLTVFCKKREVEDHLRI
jgi:hypothetical protein